MTVLGVGSNLIVRDGGIDGLVVRLAGKAFADVTIDRGSSQVIAGAAALDAAVSRAAAGRGRRAGVPLRHSGLGRRRGDG